MSSFELVCHLIKKNFLPAIKFGLVGVITAIIHFSVMWLASSFLKIDYILAVSASYFLSTIFHYSVNRYFTFSAHNRNDHWQFARYMVLWIINYIITIIVVSTTVEYFGLSAYLGVCAGVVITVFPGYFLSRYWVFNTKDVGV
jgi:putative flippase GtrA